MNAQPLEVYLYYAALERAREDADPRPVPDSPLTVFVKRITGRSGRIVYPDGHRLRNGNGTAKSRLPWRKDSAETTASSVEPATPLDEKRDLQVENVEAGPGLLDVLSPAERESTYRLMRTASWQLVFFLITTDVLGWYTAPMAFSLLGYGPGVLVYTCFWAMAFASGQILWRMYMSLDSEQYPVKCYADLGERTYGPVVRHVFNVLQSLQLVVSNPPAPEI